MKQNTFCEMAKTDFDPFNPWSLAVAHCVTHDVYYERQDEECPQCEGARMDLDEFRNLCAAADYDSGDVSKGEK